MDSGFQKFLLFSVALMILEAWDAELKGPYLLILDSLEKNHCTYLKNLKENARN